MVELASNKKAFFDYEILDRYEAGLVLFGQEVKSAKTGHVSLKGSFVTLKNGELFLINADVPSYRHAGIVPGYDSRRSRKLLLKKAEIRHLTGKSKTEGLTLVPLRLYTKKRLIKLEFEVGRGKKKYDKRENIAKREAGKKIKRALKNF